MDSAWDTLTGGLPHSEIPGSTIARISPGLFAACHVLHRLSVPRHPPDALLMRLSATPSGKKHRHRIRQSTKIIVGNPHGRVRSLLAQRPDAAVTLTRHRFPPRSRHNSLFTMSDNHRRAARENPRGGEEFWSRRSAVPPAAAVCRGDRVGGHWVGGGDRDRTDDLLLAKQALSQLSYTPGGATRLPPPTRQNPDRQGSRRWPRKCRLPGPAAPESLLPGPAAPDRWWAREDLNLRPHAYQARALTS